MRNIVRWASLFVSLTLAVPAAAQQVYAETQPRLRSFGLGIRAANVRFDKDRSATGLGVLLRLRARRVELEGELGRDRFDETRQDTRIGLGLMLRLAQGILVPYLLVGGGLNLIDWDALEGSADFRQWYLQGGAGLAVGVTGWLSLAGDVRYGIRHVYDSKPFTIQVVPPVDDDEQSLEGRVSAVLYF